MSEGAPASYHRCCERLSTRWPEFLAKREQRLSQQHRYGTAAEKVAENILEDLFTMALDWQLADVNNQVSYADLVLTRLGIKHLLIEVKRPGSLMWNQRSVERALEQAERYADEQKVRSIAVSDGVMLYACDHLPDGKRDRALVDLNQPEAPLELWWLSVDGIYRQPDASVMVDGKLLPAGSPTELSDVGRDDGALTHPKYHLPARCFAYVGDASDPTTWHLPYLKASGDPDGSRIPKAIQAILTNYRGAHLSSVPEVAIPEVLVTLARTARRLGKLPATGPKAARTYRQLQAALEQLGRLDEVLGAS